MNEVKAALNSFRAPGGVVTVTSWYTLDLGLGIGGLVALRW